MSLTLRERYRPGTSPLHQLDPRVKLVMSLLLIAGIVLTPHDAWPAYPLLWALVAGLALIAGLDLNRISREGAIALPFALAASTLILTTPGEPIFTLFGLTATAEGLGRFIAIVIKSWLAMQIALLLSTTTSVTDLLWAMTSLRVPRTLVAIMAFMIRYLYTLRDEAERLIRARAARSASHSATGANHQVNHRAGGSLMWRARVTGGMVGNLFLRSYERSERVTIAMASRGYAGHLRALNPPPLRASAIWRGAIPVLILLAIELLALTLWS